jgi:hypothetical protein
MKKANETKNKLWKNKFIMALGVSVSEQMQFEDVIKLACDQLEQIRFQQKYPSISGV